MAHCTCKTGNGGHASWCDVSEDSLFARIKELEDALQPFAIECPFIFDDATIPKAGIDAAPQQVVVNMSVGWLRIVKAREALGIKTGIP